MSATMVVDDVASARSSLRDATRAVHLRMHRLPVFEALLAGRLGRDDYRNLLHRLADYHDGFETMLEAHGNILAREGFTILEFGRADRLHDDLAALAITGPSAPAAALGRPSDDEVFGGRRDAASFPVPAGVAELFGMLYVREGSALGGRAMARALDPLLGTEARGRTFLLGSAGDGPRWTRLCSALDRAAASATDGRDAMTRGTERAFARFERSFAVVSA